MGKDFWLKKAEFIENEYINKNEGYVFRTSDGKDIQLTLEETKRLVICLRCDHFPWVNMAQQWCKSQCDNYIDLTK